LETYPGGTGNEKYYNCLCVVFNELLSPEEGFLNLKGKDRENILNK
jgi:hypothetical protein